MTYQSQDTYIYKFHKLSGMFWNVGNVVENRFSCRFMFGLLRPFYLFSSYLWSESLGIEAYFSLSWYYGDNHKRLSWKNKSILVWFFYEIIIFLKNWYLLSCYKVISKLSACNKKQACSAADSQLTQKFSSLICFGQCWVCLYHVSKKNLPRQHMFL